MDLPGKRSVLIVDDDPGIRLLLIAFLRRRGFRLLEARNGREALAEMRTDHIDLVVMDLMMPEVSGWEVLRERAADPSLLRIPVIVFTAINSREATTDVLDKHVYAVVAKPFDLEAFLTIVTTCLENPTVAGRVAA
jgi:CheY-like chemotaxis protein